MAFYHRAFWSLRCRDPIAVNFLSQGWVNIPRLWKTFPLQFQYLGVLRSAQFFLSFRHWRAWLAFVTQTDPRWSCFLKIGLASRSLCDPLCPLW